MCLSEEDKQRLLEDFDEIPRDEKWQLIYDAIDSCKWTASAPSMEGDWIVSISCSECGASFSGVAGGPEVAFDAYIDFY